MKALVILVLVASAALAAFSALNWSALAAVVPMNVGLLTVHGAPGTVALAFAFGFAAALLSYAAWQRTAQLLEARRHAQQVGEMRKLAEDAEASRVRDLRADLHTEMAAMRKTVEESANGLAAALGQIDEKLERSRPPP